MKKLVWITPIAPCFDAGGGGEIRQAHLLDALSGRFEVDLLVAGRLTDERIKHSLSGLRELDVPQHVDPPHRLRRRLRDVRWQVIQRQADEVARHRATRRALAQALNSGPRYDVVCVEYVALAGLWTPGATERWALTLHNLTSEMARQSAALAPGRRQRAMLSLEQRNAQRVERWSVANYDLVVTPSPEDAAVLPGGVAVVPNGVDLRRFLPLPVPEAARVVFTGALHTLPNREGIRWFCEAVWPQILGQIPDARLDIVGSGPPPEVMGLANQAGVTVHPDVPDVAPFLARARVAVVPLRIGTGSRLKVLEAMAAGRPVVGTTIGVGGLEITAGEDLLVGDDPDSLARELIGVLRDQAQAARLAERGRRLVEARYSWDQIGRRYADLLEAL